jgi:hypothetical protein
VILVEYSKDLTWRAEQQTGYGTVMLDLNDE